MANFSPLKKYIFYCIDRLIEHYGLSSPFLDVGCGVGDVSFHVASKGWRGKAIDFSDISIEKTKKNLAPFPGVKVERRSLHEETGTYETIFLLDILEHIEDDSAALQKIYSLLSSRGHVIISVPSNPKEWRWDDDFYGHYRRYTRHALQRKLELTGFKPISFWDSTYPIFWLMRRLYTKLKSLPIDLPDDKLSRTTCSASVNAWHIPLLSNLLRQNCFLWNAVYQMQFSCFKHRVENGHEILALASKII